MAKLVIADTALDGVTWFFANKPLYKQWALPGGDWLDATDTRHGPTPWVTASISSTGAKTYSVPVALINQLLASNTGLHVRRVSGPTVDIVARTHATLAHPSLTITTTAGTFVCPCIVSQWMDVSAGNPIQSTIVKSPFVLKFDLNAVTGTPTVDGTLSWHVSTLFAGTPPSVLHVNYLDAPELLIEGAGPIIEGIASDGPLSESHPSVLMHWEPNGSDAQLRANFFVTEPISVGGHSYQTWDDGTPVIRCVMPTAAERGVAWHRWLQPLDALPHALDDHKSRRPYTSGLGLGHDELWLRYAFKIGSDVKDGINELGVKLFGLAGTYNWSTSGAVTTPPPASDGTMEHRLWHGAKSVSNPGLFSLAIYAYDYLHKVSEFYNIFGEVRYTDIQMLEEKYYWLEQHIKMNTIGAGGEVNSDGLVEIFANGRLVYKSENVQIRGYPRAQLQDIFCNLYHGGVGSYPLVPMHYDIGPVTLATEYIGPPPSIVNPPEPEPDVPLYYSIFIRDEGTGAMHRGIATKLGPGPGPEPPQPIDCVWGEYGDWEDVGGWGPCIDGIQYKTQRAYRTHLVEAQNGGAECEGSDFIERQVSQACTVEPSGLPAWADFDLLVPGTFIEFTTNAPTDTGIAATYIKGILANWCGAAFVPEFSAYGAIAYRGGREHSASTDYGGVLVLNLETQLYEYRAKPAAPHPQVTLDNGGGPTDDWGAYLDDGTPGITHTYNGVQHWPAAWGAGAQGGIVIVGQSGGRSTSRSAEGYSATWGFDLSQTTGGNSKLTGTNLYNFGAGAGATISDAPSSGIDVELDGWWVKCRTGSGWGNRLVFSHNDGTLTSYSTPLLATGWAQLYVFEDEDLLVHLGGDAAEQIYVTVRPPSAQAGWVKVTETGSRPISYVGYMGLRYCSHPNYNCFVGIAPHHRIDDTHVMIHLLTPPPVGFRKTNPWVWSTETVVSGDGSIMKIGAGDPNVFDHAITNGAFGKLLYAPLLKALVWTRTANQKGQLIRLANMT